MRFAIASCVLVVFLGQASAADADLAGTWLPMEGKYGGEALPDEIIKSTKLVLTKDAYTVWFGMEKVDAGKVTVDHSKKPITIDIVATEGGNKGKTIPAIIELAGDTLKVCYNLEGKDRPKDFTSTKENKQLVMIYKRQKS